MTSALERVPEVADRRFPLGKYRGLTFGIEYRWNNAHIYLTGQTELSAPLSKESRGARAVLNALNRIVATYDERLEANTKELDLARSQLRDYEARLGRPFTHSAYLDELTGLRDRLKTALSVTPAESEPTAAELADRIKTLKASHAIEAAPARVREQPRAESVRRRVEAPQPVPREPAPAPEVSALPIPEDAPTDGAEDTPSGFRGQVRKSVQGRLF